jgi:hypothetical protein
MINSIYFIVIMFQLCRDLSVYSSTSLFLNKDISNLVIYISTQDLYYIQIHFKPFYFSIKYNQRI